MRCKLSLMFYRWLFLLFVSCGNIEVNTVNPQSSPSIEISKINRFYIRAYDQDTSVLNPIMAKEIWVEYCWKNEIDEGRVKKTKTGGMQINLAIDATLSKRFIDSKYFIDWRIEVPQIGVLGRGNGLYTLYLKNEIVPESISFYIQKRNRDGSYVVADSFKVSSLKESGK